MIVHIEHPPLEGRKKNATDAFNFAFVLIACPTF